MAEDIQHADTADLCLEGGATFNHSEKVCRRQKSVHLIKEIQI